VEDLVVTNAGSIIVGLDNRQKLRVKLILIKMSKV
jgi:hypothetical protein